MGKNILKCNEDFIKNYDEDSDKRYILEADAEYPKELLFNKHKNLPFLPEKMKTKLNGSEKLVCNIYNKKYIYCLHKSFKTSIKLWINIEKST